MGLLDTIKGFTGWKRRATEGGVTAGPWFLPISNGFLSAEAGSTLNWWQRGYNVEALSSPTALVEACIAAYSQTVAMCPGGHWLLQANGGRERITTSALSRILKRPNSYQTTSDFLLNAVRHLYGDGNAYALALRNARFEIAELHLMNPRSCAPLIAQTGDVFYSLGGNTVLDSMVDAPTLVPARDVLHLRLNTSPYDPLRGISPVVAAALDIAASSAIMRQQLDFYLNQARPSTALTTDMVLDAAQVQALRDRWNEQVQSLANGGWPILTGGLKPMPLSVTSEDAQLAEIMKMSEQHIALAFGIPLAILGIGGASQGSTEALMQFWLSRSLGFCISHVEEAFDKLFGLSGYPDEYTEFDTEALLRSNFRDRVEGLVRGVQGGVFAPNEARRKEGYPDVKAGDEPRVQQQLVPLSAATLIQAAPPAPGAPPAASVSAGPSSKDALNGRRISGARISRVAERRRSQSS